MPKGTERASTLKVDLYDYPESRFVQEYLLVLLALCCQSAFQITGRRLWYNVGKRKEGRHEWHWCGEQKVFIILLKILGEEKYSTVTLCSSFSGPFCCFPLSFQSLSLLFRFSTANSPTPLFTSRSPACICTQTHPILCLSEIALVTSLCHLSLPKLLTIVELSLIRQWSRRWRIISEKLNLSCECNRPLQN